MSVSDDILDAVRDAVDALLILGPIAPAPVAVVRRKEPRYIRDKDPLPVIFVSPVENLPGWQAMSRRTGRRYRVLVTIIHDTAKVWDDSEDHWLKDVRERIENVRHTTTLPGAATVYDSDFDPEPTYDAQALNEGFDVSLLGFTYHSAETRGVA